MQVLMSLLVSYGVHLGNPATTKQRAEKPWAPGVPVAGGAHWVYWHKLSYRALRQTPTAAQPPCVITSVQVATVQLPARQFEVDSA
jgi:hypothetical protein